MLTQLTHTKLLHCKRLTAYPQKVSNSATMFAMWPILLILVTLCVLQVSSQTGAIITHELEEKITKIVHKLVKHHHSKHDYDLLGYPLYMIILAIKAKVVLVIVALWGGFIISMKTLLAALWPILKALTEPKVIDHHPQFKHTPYLPEDFHGGPPQEYFADKKNHRRRQNNRDAQNS